MAVSGDSNVRTAKTTRIDPLGKIGLDGVADQPAITTYGDRSPSAPNELDLFAFLVGKWDRVGGDSFVYSIDLSNDGGESWNTGSVEMTMARVE